MKHIDLLPHEQSAASEGSLGCIIRVVEPQPPAWANDPQKAIGPWVHIHGDHPQGKCGHSDCGCIHVYEPRNPSMWTVKSPFPSPGTEVGLCEEWCHYQDITHVRRFDGAAYDEVGDGSAGYKADGFDTIDDFKRHTKLMMGIGTEEIIVRDDEWKPSSEMPDWAIRHHRVVESVKCVRCSELTEEDAKACGVLPAIKPPQIQHLEDEGFEWCPHLTELRGILEEDLKIVKWDEDPWLWICTLKQP